MSGSPTSKWMELLNGDTSMPVRKRFSTTEFTVLFFPLPLKHWCLHIVISKQTERRILCIYKQWNFPPHCRLSEPAKQSCKGLLKRLCDCLRKGGGGERFCFCRKKECRFFRLITQARLMKRNKVKTVTWSIQHEQWSSYWCSDNARIPLIWLCPTDETYFCLTQSGLELTKGIFQPTAKG